MKTLKQLTKQNKLDWVHPDITEKTFPLIKRKHKGYKLFHFDKYISSEEVKKEMQKEGYVPANLLELLEWKKWNREDLIVALGSVGEVNGSRYVPCLGRSDSLRDLDLDWFDFDWSARYRFLGVRLSSVPGKTSSRNTMEIDGKLIEPNPSNNRFCEKHCACYHKDLGCPLEDKKLDSDFISLETRVKKLEEDMEKIRKFLII